MVETPETSTADSGNQTTVTIEGLMQLLQQLNSKQTPSPPPAAAWTVGPTVSIAEKLNNQNYTLWSRLVQLEINARGRLNHIIADPPQITDPEYHTWTQQDSMVISWIIKNIESDLVNQYLDYPTARDLWKGIESTFSSGSDELQIFDLTIKANSIKQNKDSIETFYGKLVAIWKETDRRMSNPMECPKDKTTYNGILQRTRLYQFLAGINDDFDKDRRDLLLQRPLPTVDQAYASIRREIARRGIMNREDPTSGADDVGSGLASTKIRSEKSSLRREDDKARLRCSHCGGSRHTKEGCFKIIGYPDWWAENKKRGTKSRTGVMAERCVEEEERESEEDKAMGVAAHAKNETKGFFTGEWGVGLLRPTNNLSQNKYPNPN